MIPKIIHYCWFGGNPLPELAKDCIASWHKHMPEWTYIPWTEDNFDIDSAPLYVKEAYQARKFAFVSDYVRLWALEQYGGVYFDVDFFVYKSFEPLLAHHAFIGHDGCKRQALMMGVLACEPNHRCIQQMKETYNTRHFLIGDDKYDLTPNTSYFSNWLEKRGLVLDGQEKDFCEIHIYPVDYFCPILTSGEDVRTENTYCESKELCSWSGKENWKSVILSCFNPKWKTRIIKIKRQLFG